MQCPTWKFLPQKMAGQTNEHDSWIQIDMILTWMKKSYLNCAQTILLLKQHRILSAALIFIQQEVNLYATANIADQLSTVYLLFFFFLTFAMHQGHTDIQIQMCPHTKAIMKSGMPLDFCENNWKSMRACRLTENERWNRRK